MIFKKNINSVLPRIIRKTEYLSRGNIVKFLKNKKMPKNQEDNAINRYIRERIKQARINANETQGELAKLLNKSSVAISDIERGKTAVNASLLVQIAHHYKKPISYFFPDETIIKLSRLEEELIELFKQLPTTEQFREIDHLREKLKSIKREKG